MRGQIIASSCGVFKILTEKGTFEGKSRGTLKNKFGRLYVGDFVDFHGPAGGSIVAVVDGGINGEVSVGAD